MVKRHNVTKKKNKSPSVKECRRKYRILWANPYCLLDTSSGASISAREMLRQLSFQGFDVEVIGATVFDSEKGISRLPAHWQSTAEKKNFIKVIDTPLEHKLIVTKSTKRIEMTSWEESKWYALYVQELNVFKPDLVFFYGGQTLDFMISDEARQRGVPSVFYLVNGNYSGKRWCRDVDLIITDSHATADLYGSKEGIQPVPVGTFIDHRTVLSASTNDYSTRKNLLFINPSLEKGAGIVIQLAILLEKKRPDIIFEIVESRGNWNELVRQISSHYSQFPREHLDNVLVTPNTHDMRPVYSRARLLIAPSLWWESGSRVLAEAMLNGIPAIVTDRGGSPEMIGNAGIRIKLPDECHQQPYTSLPKIEMMEHLVDKIIQLFDDKVLYNEVVARARHVGATLHNINTSTQRLIQAFHPFLEKRAGDMYETFVPERHQKNGSQ